MRFTNPFRAKKALVLGCGPAGLFATHALVQNGWETTILSNKRKSDLFGCQYLHDAIPGLTDGIAPEHVAYRLVGDASGYREKVYGINEVVTSVEVLGEDHLAWDLRIAYDHAWALYHDAIYDMTVAPRTFGVARFADRPEPSIIAQPERYGLIVNSIPLRDLCYQQHEFHTTEVWAMGDAPERGQYVPLSVDPFTVVCNGSPDTGWYRASNVYNYKTVEWPIRRKPPLPGIAKVTKPLRTNCNCYQIGFPTRWVNVGRYGQWTKGVLSHHAYTQAAQL
jgi:hypothetical protein